MNIDWDKFYLAYDWAKEWQVLLAGLLVFFAAVIFAWASIRAAKISAAARPDAKNRSQPDLRMAPAPGPAAPSLPATPSDLLTSLEQLRSLIRSTLGALLQSSEKTGEKTGEKENSPAYFLCQRMLHLRIDQLPPSAHADKAAQEAFSTLLQQLNILRAHLKKDASPAELSDVLVQMNSSARGLVAALVPADERRRQASLETR